MLIGVEERPRSPGRYCAPAIATLSRLVRAAALLGSVVPEPVQKAEPRRFELPPSLP